MSTEIDELKQARYRSGKTISGHNAFLRPPTGETNSVDTRGFYFVLKEPHPNLLRTVLKCSIGVERRHFRSSSRAPGNRGSRSGENSSISPIPHSVSALITTSTA